MSVLTAAYPRVRLLPEAVAVWYEAALANTDPEMGLRIAIDLVAEPKASVEFPTPAQFNERKRVLLNRQAATTPGPPADEWKPLPRPELEKVLSEMREKLGHPTSSRSPE